MDAKTIEILSQINFECTISKQKLSNLLQNTLKQFQELRQVYYYDNDSHSVTLIIEDLNASIYLKISLLQQDQMKIEFNSSDQVDAQVAFKVSQVENFALYYFEKKQYKYFYNSPENNLKINFKIKKLKI
ncbi:hypothetical protein ABPG72_012195 [Tetrahymena utriculariae]